jgi:uncharacterized RDD family membrane protein YckC
MTHRRDIPTAGFRLIFREGRSTVVLVLWAIISFSIYSAYSVFLHARYGQTIGKMVAKVKVLNDSETDVPGLGRALLRESAYLMMMVFSLLWFLYLLITKGFAEAYSDERADRVIAVFLMGWLPLELVTLLNNPRRRAYHDMMGGTVVVNRSCFRDGE